MAKFNRGTAGAPIVLTGQPMPRGPAQTISVTETAEGGVGFVRDAKTQLFFAAVTNLGDSFYEAGSERDERLRALVYHVTHDDPVWVQRFVPFLRTQMFMRSTPVQIAAEYAALGGPGARQVVAEACHRADEPGEMLAYHMARRGRKIPAAMKRGLADAVTRLYTGYSALKYDTRAATFRFADVIELVHPRPRDEVQSALFRWLLDRRHQRDNAIDTIREVPELSQLYNTLQLDALDDDLFQALIRGGNAGLDQTYYTWERLSGRGVMDKAMWEAIMPQMGYMALIRNLRNFDTAGISGDLEVQIAARIADPDQVAQSMQFPFRFYSAWLATENAGYRNALGRALDLSTANIPALAGTTLVVIDVSGSMQTDSRGRGQGIAPYLKGSVFGLTLARRVGADIIAFGEHHARLMLPEDVSVLEGVHAMSGVVAENRLGHATNTWEAIEAHYRPGEHARIVVFTDMQSHRSLRRADTIEQIKAWGVKFYNFDLGGYANTNVEASTPGFYDLGGLSDQTFRLMANLELGNDTGWPWELQ